MSIPDPTIFEYPRHFRTRKECQQFAMTLVGNYGPIILEIQEHGRPGFKFGVTSRRPDFTLKWLAQHTPGVAWKRVDPAEATP